ncbi:unnamed protein product [Effrenium voratum]|nr:unnamed protein product [Effrenium voratum]
MPNVSDREHVVLVTYMNEVNRDFGYLQVSAEHHGLLPFIIGYGERSWWPEGLGRKVNALRRFVFSDRFSSRDIVLFADAFDVLVFGDSEKIRRGFAVMEQSTGKSIFFPAERSCYPPLAEILDRYPASSTSARYLNSGLLIGRVSEIRKVLVPDPVNDWMQYSDQLYYHEKFLDNQDAIGLDRDCSLLCVVDGSLADVGLQLLNGTVVREHSELSPLLLHFPGPGHWPAWINGLPSTHVQDTFAQVYPAEHKLLFDKVQLTLSIQGALAPRRSLEGLGKDLLLGFVRGEACLKCAWGMSHPKQCRELTWGSSNCPSGHATLLLLLVLCCLLFCCSRFRRKPMVLPSSREPAVEKDV